MPKKAVKKVAEEVVVEQQPRKDIKILYLASECQPFCATGGLGDVMGSLPKSMKAIHPEVDVRVMVPLYSDIKQEYKDMMSFVGYTYVDLAWRGRCC